MVKIPYVRCHDGATKLFFKSSFSFSWNEILRDSEIEQTCKPKRGCFAIINATERHEGCYMEILCGVRIQRIELSGKNINFILNICRKQTLHCK